MFLPRLKWILHHIMTEIETRMHLPAHKRTATVSVKGQIDKNIIKDYNHLPGNLDATATMSLYIPPQKTAPFFDAILNLTNNNNSKNKEETQK